MQSMCNMLKFINVALKGVKRTETLVASRSLHKDVDDMDKLFK